jgi:hypothetical protein
VLDHGSHSMLKGNIGSNETGSRDELGSELFASLSAASGDDNPYAFIDE